MAPSKASAAKAAAAPATPAPTEPTPAPAKGGHANAEGIPGVANVVTANPTLGEDMTRAAENTRLPAASAPPPSKKAKDEAVKADDRPQAQDKDPNDFEGTVEERAAAAPPREDWQH